jgi:hypothetical protein
VKFWKLALSFTLAVPPVAAAQSARPVSLTGTWQTTMNEDTYTVVIRADSSATYGQEIVRWRARGDSIYIALGGEWVAYRLKMRSKQLTLSGGDLPEPITLSWVGPPAARPANVRVPPDPDARR